MTGSWACAARRQLAGGAPRAVPGSCCAGGGWEAVQFDGPVLELISDSRARTDPRLAGLGPDVIGERFDERRFLTRLREDDPTRPIGDALLDQRTVAGIGNMWKAECCFAAELDPWRPAGEVRRRAGACRDRASPVSRWPARPARAGLPTRPHAVYRRAGRPCPRCGATIRQRGQWENNRVTFWCPGCQR